MATVQFSLLLSQTVLPARTVASVVKQDRVSGTGSALAEARGMDTDPGEGSSD